MRPRGRSEDRQPCKRRERREAAFGLFFEQSCRTSETQLFLDFQWDVMGNRKARETDEKYNPRSPLQS